MCMRRACDVRTQCGTHAPASLTEAADVFRRDQPRFSNNVRMSLAGRSLTIGGKTEAFDRLL